MLELEVSEKDSIRGALKATGLVGRIEKNVDIRDGAEYREAAGKMQVGDSIGGLSKAEAGRLCRAIDELHGARTSTMREKDGLYRAWRVHPRPEVKRKPRKKKAEANA